LCGSRSIEKVGVNAGVGIAEMRMVTVQHDPTSIPFNRFHPQQFDKIVQTELTLGDY
jgi:hypothetical protein